MMKKSILKNIRHAITFNDREEVFENVDILIEGPKILQ